MVAWAEADRQGRRSLKGRRMPYQLLADLVLLLHFAGVGFAVAGLPLALRWRWLAWPHLGLMILLVVTNLGGWHCPLTYLEYDLRQAAGGPAPAGSFLMVWIERLVYLPLPETWLRVLGGFWAGLNLIGHVWLWRRRRAGRGSA